MNVEALDLVVGVDHGIDVEEPRARVDAADGLHSGNRRARELLLQLQPTPPCMRVDEAAAIAGSRKHPSTVPADSSIVA